VARRKQYPIHLRNRQDAQDQASADLDGDQDASLLTEVLLQYHIISVF
jgi:hypothetical protein